MFTDSLPAIRSHHERYDGSGYPDVLKGENIPYLGRIVALCDSFDAITGKRPYKEVTSLEYGLDEIKRNSGTQFDPKLAEEFCKCIEQNKEVAQKILES